MTYQPITGFHQDDEGHWIAKLACGHTQHVRHTPPWQSRPWTQTAEGRTSMISHALPCTLCEQAVN